MSSIYTDQSSRCYGLKIISALLLGCYYFSFYHIFKTQNLKEKKRFASPLRPWHTDIASGCGARILAMVFGSGGEGRPHFFLLLVRIK